MNARVFLIISSFCISASGFLGGCSDVAMSTDLTTESSGNDASAHDAPMFLEPLVVDGSAKGLETSEEVQAAMAALPMPASRALAVNVHVDALNADHRKEGYVIKNGVKHYISWCIGTRYTLTLFGGHLIVVESTSVQEAGGFWTLNGDIVEGGKGTVHITVSDTNGTVDGRIYYESEHRDFYIVSANAGTAHVLYAPVYTVADKEYGTFDVRDDPLEELQRQKARYLEKLADPEVQGESRKAWQWALDTVTRQIEEMIASKKVDGSPRWLGYIVQRPESHSCHHQRGVHANNYSDLPLFDLLHGRGSGVPLKCSPLAGILG